MNREQARKILGAKINEKNLGLKLGKYLTWESGDTEALLDGYFDAEELEAIAWWMKNDEEISHPCSGGINVPTKSQAEALTALEYLVEVIKGFGETYDKEALEKSKKVISSSLRA